MKVNPSQLSLNHRNTRAISELRDEIVSIKRHELERENITEQLEAIEVKLLSIDEKINCPQKLSDVEQVKLLEMNCATTRNVLDEIVRENYEIREKLDSFDDALTQLNRIKVDRAELNGLLSGKADYDVVRKKVSSEYFEAARSDIDGKLLKLISQLSMREGETKVNLDDIHRTLDSKLCKADVATITEHVDQKIQKVYDRLKTLNSIMREKEAAGTKFRLLKGVKCISCHSDAFMKVVEDSPLPKRDSMSTPKSMRQSNHQLKEMRAHTSGFKLPIKVVKRPADDTAKTEGETLP